MNRYGSFFILVMVALWLYPAVSLAGEKVELKFAYMPKTHYTIKETSTHDMTMKLDNPFAVPEEVRNKFPMSIDSRGNRVIEIVTGSLAEGGTFPITFEVTKDEQNASINGGFPQRIDSGASKLVGVRAHGTTDSGGNLKFSKFDGKELSQEDQKLIASVFDQVGKSLSQLESKPVSVGESFTQKVPINIPVPGVASVTLDMTVVYKLVGVKDKTADFDAAYTLKLAASTESEPGKKIEAVGDGTGKLVYDIQRKVALQNTNNITMQMTIPLDGAAIVFSTKSAESSVTEIH